MVDIPAVTWNLLSCANSIIFTATLADFSPLPSFITLVQSSTQFQVFTTDPFKAGFYTIVVTGTLKSTFHQTVQFQWNLLVVNPKYVVSGSSSISMFGSSLPQYLTLRCNTV